MTLVEAARMGVWIRRRGWPQWINWCRVREGKTELNMISFRTFISSQDFLASDWEYQHADAQEETELERDSSLRFSLVELE